MQGKKAIRKSGIQVCFQPFLWFPSSLLPLKSRNLHFYYLKPETESITEIVWDEIIRIDYSSKAGTSKITSRKVASIKLSF